MTYRKFDTGTWNDPWFEGLSPRAKLGFIYFWTNSLCPQSGIYEISPKRISFDLGYHIDTIYSEIESKIYHNKEENFIWIKNFFRHQCQNSKFALSALNSLKENPKRLQLFITYNKELLEGYNIDLEAYHIDTISIPYPTEQNRTEQKQNRTEQKTSLSDSDEYRLSELLFSFILKNNPKAKQPNLESWSEHIRLAITRDKRTLEELERVIKWCQNDSFWKSNILSTAKLREKFDQLWLKMNQQTTGDKLTDQNLQAAKAFLEAT